MLYNTRCIHTLVVLTVPLLTMFQDTMNPGKQMIIIRSLVPGGVAEQDGRLEPGDRLISVNNVNLFNATLEEAVLALKGTPRGVVMLRALKPARFGESSTDSIQVSLLFQHIHFIVGFPCDYRLASSYHLNLPPLVVLATS